MKAFICLLLLGGLLSIGSCRNKQASQKGDVCGDYTILVADSILIEQEKRIEDHYRQITDPLEEVIDGQNSFDYVPINNKTKAWYKKCKNALVKVYDSNNPMSELSDNAKVDSLFKELEFYYEFDNDEILSRHRGISIQRTKKSIILFYITEKTLAMLQQDSSCVKEQMAWERFQKALEEYYLTAEDILSTGGTGNVVLCLMAMNDIYKNRENDLDRMLKSHCADTKSILSARDIFLHSVDSIEKELNEDFSKGEWEIFKYVPQLMDKMHKAKGPLIIALDDWISERKRYHGCAKAIIDLNNIISDVR